MIVYYPPSAFDGEFPVVSAYGPVIDADHCSYFQIRDIRIEYVRGDAIKIRDCSNVMLSGLDIEDCSGLGIRIDGGVNHLVHSCRIKSMGRGAIDVCAGDWRRLIPSGSVIENCDISELSRVDRTYTPAVVLEGMGIKVRHNSFVDIPSSAMRVESCDALIELNYFRRCVYESGDQGAIDMWANPLYRGNIIRWNDFDSIINRHAHLGAAAIRHDDYISGFMVSENIIRKGSGRGVFGAIQFNQGKDNYVEGNVFVDWHKALSGRSVSGSEWKRRITAHPKSGLHLETTEWRSDAWQKKYPRLKTLMSGSDNHNYIACNLFLGSGAMGNVSGSVKLANKRGSADIHAGSLDDIVESLPPWLSVPVSEIGRY
jgi:hypothetical protein